VTLGHGGPQGPDDLDPPDWVSAGQPVDPGASRRAATPTVPRSSDDRIDDGYDAPYDHGAEDDAPDEAPAAPPGARLPTRARTARRRAERSRQRRRTLAVLGVLAALILPVVLAGGWFVWELNPPGSTGKAITFEVKSGWGDKEVGDSLQDHGVIGSSLAFQIWAKISGGDSFRPGSYALHEHLGVRAAVNKLRDGPTVLAAPDLKLLVPPGLTLEKIAARVGQLPGRSADKFLAAARSGLVRSKFEPAGGSLEGLTWPDTYFIGVNDTEQQILQRIVTEFDSRMDALGLSGPLTNTLTPYQTIVAGSLVQAESGSDADSPKIAAVILNRLHKNIPLQIDATLCYAKGGCPPLPTDADKKIDSPYNTYKVLGLPPTPIETITAAAMRAAMNPDNDNYLYYVACTNGKTLFATTQQEHDRNVARARSAC
jgi:UPF0755 protein